MNAAPDSDPALAAIAELVRRRVGLADPPRRRPFAFAAIRRAMARARIAAPLDYLAVLRDGTRQFDELVAELTVGETYFFRHPEQFAAIREQVLPALHREAEPGRPLRVWSAGCASGEEAYSLAILLDEAAADRHSVVVGSDVSRPALQRARAGRYSAWSLRDAGGALAGAYLEPVDGRFCVVERLRHRVIFRHVNLLDDPYPPEALGECGADLILCRNVLIYFDTEAIVRVAARLLDALAPGGWLVTGPSDPLLPCAPPTEIVATTAGLFYRRPGAAPLHRAVPARPRPERKAAAPPRRAPAHRRTPLPAPIPTPAPAAAIEDELPQRIHALIARGDIAAAEAAARRATRDTPQRLEGHFLHALLLLDLGRHDEAAEAARHLIYLDPDAAIGHLLLGTILQRCGRLDAAEQAFRHGRDELLRLAPDATVALGGGEAAEHLIAASDGYLAALAQRAQPMPRTRRPR